MADNLILVPSPHPDRAPTSPARTTIAPLNQTPTPPLTAAAASAPQSLCRSNVVEAKRQCFTADQQRSNVCESPRSMCSDVPPGASVGWSKKLLRGLSSISDKSVEKAWDGHEMGGSGASHKEGRRGSLMSKLRMGKGTPLTNEINTEVRRSRGFGSAWNDRGTDGRAPRTRATRARRGCRNTRRSRGWTRRRSRRSCRRWSRRPTLSTSRRSGGVGQAARPLAHQRRGRRGGRRHANGPTTVSFSISAGEGRNIVLRNLVGKIAANLNFLTRMQDPASPMVVVDGFADEGRRLGAYYMMRACSVAFYEAMSRPVALKIAMTWPW